MKSLLVLVGTGLGLLGWALFAWQGPQVEIANASGLDVERLEVRVDGRTVARGSLQAGATDRHSVPTRREGPLTVQLDFVDGGHAELAAGWFSPGQGDPARLRIVSPDSVQVDAW